MQNPHVPGAGSEPDLAPAIHLHRVTFQKAGWFTFAYCACGYLDCDPDVEDLRIRAASHDIWRAA